MNNLINESCSEAETEAPLTEEEMCWYRYYSLTACAKDSLALHTLGDTAYFLVAKPLDEPYYKHKDRITFYNVKGLSKVMSKISCKLSGIKQYAASTELYANKTHHNVIFRSNDKGVLAWHDQIWFHKWKIYCKPVKISLDSSIDYIYKEAKERIFQHYTDYVISKPVVIKPEVNKRNVNSDFLIDIV